MVYIPPRRAHKVGPKPIDPMAIPDDNTLCVHVSPNWDGTYTRCGDVAEHLRHGFLCPEHNNRLDAAYLYHHGERPMGLDDLITQSVILTDARAIMAGKIVEVHHGRATIAFLETPTIH